MQSIVFTAALAAFFLASVPGSALPRAYFAPATIVTPGISFNPAEIGANELSFLSLQAVASQIAQTADLADGLALQISDTTGVVRPSQSCHDEMDRADLNLRIQAADKILAVAAQLGSNAATIAANVARVIASTPTAITPVPSITPMDHLDVGSQAEEVRRLIHPCAVPRLNVLLRQIVLQAMTLITSLSDQIAAVRGRLAANAGTLTSVVENGVLFPALVKFQTTAARTIVTIGIASNLALSAAITLSTEDRAVVYRVRHVQFKLRQLLSIASAPKTRYSTRDESPYHFLT